MANEISDNRLHTMKDKEIIKRLGSFSFTWPLFDWKKYGYY